MYSVQIVVGNKPFSAKLCRNAAAQVLTERFPITTSINELHGNEKYYHFTNSLPANLSRPSQILAGDLMLYGSNRLVLFYQSFSTAYSYTPLGYIENSFGLAQALETGSVQVTFQTQ